MDVTLENSTLRVTIKSKGAELVGVRNKETQLEYMWSGDPAFWGKSSPVLFPVVGTLKEDAFLFRNKKFHLTRHGFARDAEFEIAEAGKENVVFTLGNTQASLHQYPFTFQLNLKYKLEGNSLHVNYTVQNMGNEEMYFSIGGHPAFRVPLVDGTQYDDYFLQFNKIENVPRWPIGAGGLIESNPIAFLNDTDKIYLTKTLFQQDALVLKHLRSDRVSIKSTIHHHGLDFHFEGFPFLGIWAAKNADFVCIEPWCGLADSVTHNQEFISKEGIEKVDAGKSWSRTWKAKFY